jgi:hypothetical protein
MIDKEYEEKFQEWIDDCPCDFNQIGYQKNRLKGTFLKYGGCDMSRPMYVFYLPECEEE